MPCGCGKQPVDYSVLSNDSTIGVTPCSKCLTFWAIVLLVSIFLLSKR